MPLFVNWFPGVDQIERGFLLWTLHVTCPLSLMRIMSVAKSRFTFHYLIDRALTSEQSEYRQIIPWQSQYERSITWWKLFSYLTGLRIGCRKSNKKWGFQKVEPQAKMKYDHLAHLLLHSQLPFGQKFKSLVRNIVPGLLQQFLAFHHGGCYNFFKNHHLLFGCSSGLKIICVFKRISDGSRETNEQ